MTIKMNNQVPAKRPVVETPLEVHNTDNPKAEEHKKMEHMADRAAHKANKTEQNYDEKQGMFKI